MLQQNILYMNWQFLLVGLVFIIMKCDARAVNVSNTWTMPQEGLNVFYRFFRDRISWFEADAVCQFHHANLVTVDNSFQFDATRDLLRELDVNDIVWIGLMRPQNSDRFMWSSNSRPLVADTGYWAESLPLMDAPLCAVIDPIRDYRWHALRCGGPETASFLCEMPVPSWADACNLKDMPNLTLQYMADTASIELIRNCQEEGLLRTMCRGKQDRERALQELICPRERLEAQRINDITNSHFKSLQIINSIPSDNNENNDIELLPMEVNYGPHYPEELQTEKNTVQRLIEQFNVDELMQADEPSNIETVSSFYKIPGLIPKPVKKSAKKVLDYPKRDSSKQKGSGILEEQVTKNKKKSIIQMDEIMMGDQPLQGEPEIPEQFLNEEVSNEILEPLPHIKKTNIHKEDSLEKMEKEATAMKKSMQKTKEIELKKMLMITLTSATTTTTPITTEYTTTTQPSSTTTITPIPTNTSTTKIPLTTTPVVKTNEDGDETRLSEDHTHKHNHEIHPQFDNSWGHSTTTTSSATISHPIHPQQQRNTIITGEMHHPHAKESTDSSHFIPPMLMVKSHYVPPHSEHDHHHQLHYQPQHFETTTQEKAETTLKHQEIQTEDAMMMTVTTPKVLDLQETTLTTLNTSIRNTDNKQHISVTRQEEHQSVSTITEADSSIKPITVEQITETEEYKNSKNLQYEEKPTTTTATTLQSAASTTFETAVSEKTILLATNTQEINKNNVGQKKDKDGKQEIKQPQATSADAETTQATKLVAITETFLKSSNKFHDLETATYNKENIQETTETTTVKPTIQIEEKQQDHVLTIEQKLTAIENEKNKKHLQTTTETIEKLAATQTTEVVTTPTIATTQVTHQSPTTIETETHSMQQLEKYQAVKEELNEDKQKDQDKKEVVIKPTEILATSTTITKSPHRETDTPAATTIYTPITSTIETTTATVKPITTTLPQNEVKSNETSFSSTGAIAIAKTTTTTTTNMATTKTEEDRSTTTITFPSSKTSASLLPSSLAAIAASTTETEAESTTKTTTTVTARAETSTQTPSSSKTTRNFLKVTTEIPFKPNRRRSLTKPETVSYMKKILG